MHNGFIEMEDVVKLVAKIANISNGEAASLTLQAISHGEVVIHDRYIRMTAEDKDEEAHARAAILLKKMRGKINQKGDKNEKGKSKED